MEEIFTDLLYQKVEFEELSRELAEITSLFADEVHKNIYLKNENSELKSEIILLINIINYLQGSLDT